MHIGSDQSAGFASTQPPPCYTPSFTEKLYPYIPRTRTQALLMCVTSLSYLVCAFVWLQHNQPLLGMLLVLVCVASVAADGVRIDHPLVRAVDKILALSAASWSL
jgi:hypothetical protein